MQEQKKRYALIFLIIFLAISPMVYGESDLTQQGVAFLKAQRFDEAIGVFTKVTTADPGNAKAIYYRGMARYYKGDLDQAIADYTQAIKIDPNYATAYDNRATAWYGQGNDEQAEADLAKAKALRDE
mgnify:CR=1 FL=1